MDASYEVLLGQAEKQYNKSQMRVSSAKLLSEVEAFLNSDNNSTTVEHIFPADTKLSSINNRFKTALKDNALTDLVLSTVHNDHVYLVKRIAAES